MILKSHLIEILKCIEKETTTDYGKKLIKNEILGQSWISNQMNESKKI